MNVTQMLFPGRVRPRPVPKYPNAGFLRSAGGKSYVLMIFQETLPDYELYMTFSRYVLLRIYHMNYKSNCIVNGVQSSAD